MKVISIVAFATAAINSVAALRFTNINFNNITVGKPFNLTWADASGPVRITLLKGATPAFFTSAGVIGGNLTTTSYLWTPSTSLFRDVYDLKYEDSTRAPVYSFQFEILGGRIAGASSTSASSSASSTSSAPSYTATFAYPPVGAVGSNS